MTPCPRCNRTFRNLRGLSAHQGRTQHYALSPIAADAFRLDGRTYPDGEALDLQARDLAALASRHTATYAGTTPKGHWYCTCGRKIRPTGEGTRLVHTSGLKRIDR